MIVVSVTYPAGEGARFDTDYYMKQHMPLVEARLRGSGLREAKVLHGSGAPGGGAPACLVMALLSFDSASAFQQAIEQHGAELMADIPNFTNVQPVIQLNDVLT